MQRFIRWAGVMGILGTACVAGLGQQPVFPEGKEAVKGKFGFPGGKMPGGFGPKGFLPGGKMPPGFQPGGKMPAMELPDTGPSNGFSNQVNLPTNRDQERKLEAVRDYMQTGGWREVTQALQEILDHPQDCFMPVKRGPNTVWVSVRAEANRLLGSMPAKGKEVYEVLSGPRAASLLRAAKKENNPEGLARVALNYFHTHAGLEATDLLGTHHLDRGRYLMAASCFRQLLDRPDVPPLCLFKASLAFRRSGDEAAFSRAWKKLAAKAPDGLTMGEHQVSLDELKTILDRKPAPMHAKTRTRAGDWLMFRGDACRDDWGMSAKPILESKWKLPTVHETTSRTWIEDAVGQLQSFRRPVLPGSFPIAVGGKIIYRTQRGITAVERGTGELAWESTLRGGFDNPEHPDNSENIHANLESWVRNYLNANPTHNPHIVVENSVLGTLSSDGTRVFGIEDVAVPPFEVFNYYGRGGIMMRPGFGPQTTVSAKKFTHNQLVAIEIDSGRIKWALGSDKEGAFQDAVFLGPPLPLGGKLYTLYEKEQELQLACLDPRNGKPAWTQPLVTYRKGIQMEFGRRSWAAHLAHAEGILICPSNSGAIVAVDLLTHSLLWAHAYAQDPPSPQGQRVMINGKVRIFPNRGPILPRLNCNWKNSAPIIADGKVLLTAPDATTIQCLNLRDGSLVWSKAWVDNDAYLAGVYKGKVVIVGNQSCRALNLSDGNQAWITTTGLPSGQGVASGKLYYLPLRSGQGDGPSICTLDLENGRIVDRIASPRNEIPGNLIYHQGFVISQTATAVAAFPTAK
jgi:outer membrane protein assembly factor BamB